MTFADTFCTTFYRILLNNHFQNGVSMSVHINGENVICRKFELIQHQRF